MVPMAESLFYYNSEELAEARLDTEHKRLLKEINDKIAGRQTLGDILDYFFDSTREIYPCDRISVAFLEEDGQRLVSYWTRTLYDEIALKTGYTETVRGSSLEDVLWNGRIRIIGDVEKYLGLHPGSNSTRLLVREGIGSNLTCPLKVDGRVVGALFRSSKVKHAYSGQHAVFQQAVSERLSQAVEKAYLIDKLDRRNRDYMEMLGFVSHELKSPLATIMMNADLLRKGFAGPLRDGQRKAAERIAKKGSHLNELIRDYLDLARLEGEGIRPKFVDIELIDNVVNPSLDQVRELLSAANMKLQTRCPESLRVKCEPGLIRSVLTNLLNNAAKYGSDGGEVEVRADAEEGGARIAVRNDGAGFRNEDRHLLFKRFSRLKTPEHSEVAGTGVGLYTCWRIVNLHKGTIEAASQYGQWAEFRFWIPYDPGKINNQESRRTK